MFEHWGRRWECIRGYAANESIGWFFELWDITDSPNRKLALFACRPDGGEFSISQYEEGLSPEILEWFIAEARAAIGPIIQ